MITRKKFIRDLSIFAVASSLPKVSIAADSKKPNIIKFIIDDIGYADMSFSEHSPADVKTPNIDRIRSMGTYFTNAYATAPICSPSRTGLITGRYQQRWGNYWYSQGGLPLNELTIPQALKKMGYSTKKIGKCHHNGGPGQHPLKHGFDEFLGFIHHTWDYARLSEKDVQKYGKGAAKAACIGPLERNGKKVSFENSYTTEVFTDEAMEYINRKHDSAYYLQVDFNAVHHPTYVGHPKYLKKQGIEQFPFWDPKKENWRSWHKKWGHLGKVDPNGRKRYLATLNCLDDCIGKILDTIQKKGELENTIIIFISDNGGTINTYSNNTPLRGYKYMFAEGGIRVPLLISYPAKLPKNMTCQALVSAMDVFPTLMNLTGGKTPTNLDGKSLMPLLNKETKKDNHEYLCWAKSARKGTKIVRCGKWKLAMNAGWEHENFKIKDDVCSRDTSINYPSGIVLFDLEKDPGETTDLANKNPKVVKKLKAIHKNWQAQMNMKSKKS